MFRAFQSNLLSLVSHELRTPLMGILNALGMLEEGGDSGPLSSAELIRMARSNAQRLQQTLAALLDLAALESGTFHARLREVDLHRLVSSRVDAHRPMLGGRGVELDALSVGGLSPVLADPQRLGRALELVFQIVVPRAAQGSKVEARLASTRFTLRFGLSAGMEGLWDEAWTHSLAGYQGGVAAPGSAFAGVMQSEQAFLSRMEEGLGSEFLLIHEILRLHGGAFTASREGGWVSLELELPSLSSEEGLKAVLASRAYEISTALGTVALVLLEVPQGMDADRFTATVRKTLFRASDAVYSLRELGQAALVLDDCKPEDAPRLVARIRQQLVQELGQQLAKGPSLRYGLAQCPADGHDPAMLLPLAARRLAEQAPEGA